MSNSAFPSGAAVTTPTYRVHAYTKAFLSNSTDTFTTTSTSWAEVDSTNLRLTIAAATGDLLLLNFSCLGAYQDTGDSGFVDAHTVVSGTRTNSVGQNGAAVSNSTGGVSAWRFHQMSGGVAQNAGGTVLYVAQAGDISGGNIIFSLVFRSQTSARTLTLHKQGVIPLIFSVVNIGPSGSRSVGT